ncbi:MAG TPA: response regulator [Sphingobacteriaceae bacterium]|nr:response regulator [Sphingobacteriaceae bacterium]
MHQDKKGNIWAGTIGGGLSKIISQKDGTLSFETITTDNGLLTNDIETLLEDEEGNFWIGSIGLTKYNPLKQSFSFYDANDGLQSNAFKVWSAFKTEDGEMIFGGINGFNIFYPGHIKKKMDVSSPQLTNLFINNIPVKVGSEIEGDVILNKTLAYSSAIRLNHKIKNFGIEFSSVHSHDFSKIIYRYRLKGYDDNWIYANSKKRFVSYYGLPSGSYKFELQASGGGGIWNPSPATLSLDILPSFWESKTGYLLYALVILIALFLQRKYALIRLDTKHKLELEKARQEQDIKLYEEKIQFFTTISHELRTPLTLIMTPIEQIMEQVDENSVISHRLDIAHKNAHRLKILIDQILDVRKLELGKLALHTEDIGIDKVLNSIFIQFEDLAAQKNLKYSYTASTNSRVRIDIGKIEQVLINLLANAIHFADNEGKIRLEADLAGDEVVIKVTNTGSYLTMQQQGRIFEPFYQVKEKDKSGGTGLGLTISKYLVELHHGKIKVYSRNAFDLEDAITTFIISLPVIDEPGNFDSVPYSRVMKSVEEEEIAFIERVTASTHRPTIILIDDNEELRSILHDEFQKDYRVLEAPDGKQGLKLIRKIKPDLIITDIMMPLVDGLTLCKAVKTDMSTAHIPIIILTAKTADDDKIEGLEAMADDYMFKPFNLKELRIKIKNMIYYHENLKRKIHTNIALKPAILDFDSRDERMIKDIVEVIEKNIDNPNFTVDLLCAEAAISRPVMFRKIKALTGMSIQIFILDIRLKRAAQLLSTKAFSVSEVMYKTGFSSPSYFNKAFKKRIFSKSNILCRLTG